MRAAMILTYGFIASLATGLIPTAIAARPAATETIVFIRHGEKPEGGLGQLDCQGLNRALALPGVMTKLFGKPDVIFAPDPAEVKNDYGHPYDYVRPLATIEPTAIALDMPIDASIGVSNIDALRRKLEEPAYAGALAFVAWEHKEIVKLARQLLAENGGDPGAVPEWKAQDFDSIYVIAITRTGEKTVARFDHRDEGLDGEPTSCPGQPPG